MVSFDKSEDVGFVSGSKTETIRHFQYNQMKVLGNYAYKHGLFDKIAIGRFLVIDKWESPMVISESEANRLGYSSKEEYFSYNFNGFNKDMPEKMCTKFEFINLDLVYGYIEELDAWIDTLSY